MRRLVVPVAMMAALPAGLFAQGTSGTATKEKDRAKARQGKAPVKVLTEDDLRNANRGTVSQPASNEAVEAAAEPSPSPAASPQAASGTKDKTEDELRAERETQWREKLQKAQAEAAELGLKADQLQMQLNDLSQNLYTSTRANLASELEATRAKLSAAQQAITALQEEGRRSSFR